MFQKFTAFQSILLCSAIVTLSAITIRGTPTYAAPIPTQPEPPTLRQPATLDNLVITPNCPDNQPFPFPNAYCPTGGRSSLNPDDLKEIQNQLHDRIQFLRRSVQQDTILVPILQITF